MIVSGYLMNGFKYPSKELAHIVARRQLANYQNRLNEINNQLPPDLNMEHINWIYQQIKKWEELVNETA